MNRDDYLKCFGNAVKVAREAQGLTQEELAWRCKFHPTYISLVENGHRNPILTNVVRLALGLGVTVSQIIPEQDVD